VSIECTQAVHGSACRRARCCRIPVSAEARDCCGAEEPAQRGAMVGDCSVSVEAGDILDLWRVWIPLRDVLGTSSRQDVRAIGCRCMPGLPF
jgi:hypothetical protein